ncbi:ABC transporter substrate-binding protein [Azomonas macrocytogenes]|uniref:NitT/TauT family transport system substrate-binding protein n=1 Tax=Azomonas macrocytogenes TaxID=69962 RepID=A0A839T7B8_AZOMA|nr:ABC transporter substrate-binding protein [Azomonas macrocytogenes]MBB3105371.1 NitT/TauT family transport system substrate-binding protein [Azomonas macrocytogenes]
MKKLFPIPFFRGCIAVSLAASVLWAWTPAWAEGRIRIANQFGINELMLHVVKDRHLIENHGAAEGLQIKVEWLQIAGGAAINDALLSGSADIGSVGIAPMLTLWDRTLGRQNIRAVAALGAMPNYLLSRNPLVKSIADLCDKDRIAVPAVIVSQQARTLQYAAAQLYGDADYKHFDHLTMSLPHPDAAAAMLAGGSEINTHFANAPFQNQELKDPAVHKVLDSFDVFGGPQTGIVVMSTQTFHDENPRTYRAFLGALDEAAKIINADRKAAASAYLRVMKSKLPLPLVEEVVQDPQVTFTMAPQNSLKLAQFLHRVGQLKNRPESWHDYFFPEVYFLEGS